MIDLSARLKKVDPRAFASRFGGPVGGAPVTSTAADAEIVTPAVTLARERAFRGDVAAAMWDAPA